MRAASPYGSAPHTSSKPSSVKDQVLRKKPASPQNAAAALGILRALDPHAMAPPPDVLQRQPSEDNGTEYSYRGDREREDKKERKGLWGRATEHNKERERERERQRERERKKEQDQNELTRMIGVSRYSASYSFN